MTKAAVPKSHLELIVRSPVQAGLEYRQYLPELREDFEYCCGYCTTTESEAQAVRFTIDHYEPKSARPELENAYDNLIYACNQCNTLKGKRYPSAADRTAGRRFFRPDVDIRSQHFEEAGKTVDPKTLTGDYNIQALDLNRGALQTIRDHRLRLERCVAAAPLAIAALMRFPIDLLPPHQRRAVHLAALDAEKLFDEIQEDISALLARYGRSPLLDDDPDKVGRARERRAALEEIKGLHPETWFKRRRLKKASSTP